MGSISGFRHDTPGGRTFRDAARPVGRMPGRTDARSDGWQETATLSDWCAPTGVLAIGCKRGRFHQQALPDGSRYALSEQSSLDGARHCRAGQLSPVTIGRGSDVAELKTLP
jgi:hypothetical protein